MLQKDSDIDEDVSHRIKWKFLISQMNHSYKCTYEKYDGTNIVKILLLLQWTNFSRGIVKLQSFLNLFLKTINLSDLVIYEVAGLGIVIRV
jgi:hypothetical protein